MKDGRAKWITMVLLMVSSPLIAKITNELQYKFETSSVVGTGDHAPFWHTSNRQGLSSIHLNNAYMRNAVLGCTNNTNGLIFDYGIDIGAGVGLDRNIFLHQLFIEANYKWLGFSVGLKERWSDKNSKLSSGALTWSGNSKPIPEFRAGIPEYVNVPIGGEWLAIKGHVAYGRFTDDIWRKRSAFLASNNPSYADGIIFHSKDLFIRIGDMARFPLQGYIGLEMNTMFGGTIYNQYHDNVYYSEYKLPSGFNAYCSALLPFNKVGKQGNDNGDIVGSWHLGLDYTYEEWCFKTYYEHFFEDHSSMLGIEHKDNAAGDKSFIFYGFKHNWCDGLFGIELATPTGFNCLHHLVLEFLNTKGQSGPIIHSGIYNSYEDLVVEEVDGRDELYNHSVYDSYTHHGYAIGNPVLISPVYNEKGYMRFRSNRVHMFHLGVDGEISRCIDYRLLATTTRHWGCYGAPLKEVERVTSVMLECSYKFGGEYGWRISLSGAADFDSGSDGAYLLGNNRGVMVTVSKTWKVR